MSTPWKSIYPELPVTDLAAAILYFEKSLGFSTDFHLETMGYAKVSRDEDAIFLAETKTAFEPRTCMIYTEDIRAVYAEMEKSGVTIHSELKDLSVGTTEFSIRIVDGHIFTFFQ